MAVGDNTETAMDTTPATDYQGEEIYLEYITSGVISTTVVAPMDIDDMRSTLLSKDNKFSKGAVKVYGPDREIMEVRDWVTLVKTPGLRSGGNTRLGTEATVSAIV